MHTSCPSQMDPCRQLPHSITASLAAAPWCCRSERGAWLARGCCCTTRWDIQRLCAQPSPALCLLTARAQSSVAAAGAPCLQSCRMHGLLLPRAWAPESAGLPSAARVGLSALSQTAAAASETLRAQTIEYSFLLVCRGFVVGSSAQQQESARWPTAGGSVRLFEAQHGCAGLCLSPCICRGPTHLHPCKRGLHRLAGRSRSACPAHRWFWSSSRPWPRPLPPASPPASHRRS